MYEDLDCKVKQICRWRFQCLCIVTNFRSSVVNYEYVPFVMIVTSLAFPFLHFSLISPLFSSLLFSLSFSLLSSLSSLSLLSLISSLLSLSSLMRSTAISHLTYQNRYHSMHPIYSLPINHNKILFTALTHEETE